MSSHSSNAQMPTQPHQESRTKRINKKKTTKHGRRRRVTEEQHPYDKWFKMRGKIEEADIERKTLIQKFAAFLQKVLPNSNAYPKQTMAAPPPPPPAARKPRRARWVRYKDRDHRIPSGPPSSHAKVKAYSHPL